MDKLIDTQENVYEMTCVAIKEAAIVAAREVQTAVPLDANGNPEEEPKETEKIVSRVLAQVLNGEIEYTIDEND